MDRLSNGVFRRKARPPHPAEEAHRSAEPVAGERVYPYDLPIGT